MPSLAFDTRRWRQDWSYTAVKNGFPVSWERYPSEAEPSALAVFANCWATSSAWAICCGGRASCIFLSVHPDLRKLQSAPSKKRRTGHACRAPSKHRDVSSSNNSQNRMLATLVLNPTTYPSPGHAAERRRRNHGDKRHHRKVLFRSSFETVCPCTTASSRRQLLIEAGSAELVSRSYSTDE
jgi:hypothetical protein